MCSHIASYSFALTHSWRCVYLPNAAPRKKTLQAMVILNLSYQFSLILQVISRGFGIFHYFLTSQENYVYTNEITVCIYKDDYVWYVYTWRVHDEMRHHPSWRKYSNDMIWRHLEWMGYKITLREAILFLKRLLLSSFECNMLKNR